MQVGDLVVFQVDRNDLVQLGDGREVFDLIVGRVQISQITQIVLISLLKAMRKR